MNTRRHLLLAIDTSGPDAGLVLAGGGMTDLAALPLNGGFARTEDLAVEASALLARHGFGPGDLTAVAAVVGPGSYTGLRSGLAFLRGLAFARSLPAVPVGTLELLAWRAGRAGELLTAVWPAGKGRSLIATYSCGEDDIQEIASPVMFDDHEGAERLTAVRKLSRIAVTSSPASEEMTAAARAAGIEMRVPASGTLARFADLATSRILSGRATTMNALLPVYVGLAAIRPAPDPRHVSASCE